MADTSLRNILRPKTLEDVIGLEEIKPLIKKFIEQEKKCWLFHGPTGTGKTSLALIVARGLRQGDEDEIWQQNSADCTVGFMRDFLRDIRCYPMSGKYRVIILDEAQALPDEVKTMLLSTLEDGPSANVWILCTTDKSKLSPALRDRCESFALDKIGTREREELVLRAAKHLEFTPDTGRFLKEINKNEFCSARDVLNAFEKFANGMPAEAAVRS